MPQIRTFYAIELRSIPWDLTGDELLAQQTERRAVAREASIVTSRRFSTEEQATKALVRAILSERVRRWLEICKVTKGSFAI